MHIKDQLFLQKSGKGDFVIGIIQSYLVSQKSALLHIKATICF